MYNGNGLEKYYSLYLTEVRGSTRSTVGHYLTALNNVSAFLKKKGLIHSDIYEVGDLDTLKMLRDILFADEEFVEYNRRGHRMYSSGLKNYIQFAEGHGFAKEDSRKMLLLDIPLTPADSSSREARVWSRSGILRKQTIERAGHRCEIDANHKSFIAENDNKPYMEGHHAIPIMRQEQFGNSLDVYANIVCLCPVCHRRIHYGLYQDRESMMEQIYESRGERLANSGIRLSKEEFVRLVG